MKAGASVPIAGSPPAQRPESLAAASPRERKRAAACANPGRLVTDCQGNSGNGELRELRTIDDAVALLDEWTAAYREERAERTRYVDALHERIFWLELDVTLATAEATLYRAQLEDAGIEPMDCSAAAAAPQYPAEAEEVACVDEPWI